MANYYQKSDADSELRKEIARTQQGWAVLNCPVFANAVQIAQRVYEYTGTVPQRYASWSDQIERAACSIAANLAEGYGRGTDGQAHSFFRYARGSAFEVLTFLICVPPGLQPVDSLLALVRDLGKLLDALVIDTAKARLGLS